MTDSVSPTELLLRAERLAERFAESAPEADRSGELQFSQLQALKDAGLLRLVTPREQGGAGGGLREAVEVVSAIARGEPGTAMVLAMHYNQHSLIGLNDGRWPEALARRIVAESVEGISLINAAYVEPFVGSASHGALPQTRARLQDDKWVLSGHKKYVTGVEGLSWIRVMGVTEGESPRVGHFLVPGKAPGVRVEKTWNAMGMRATASHDVVFENVELPLDHFFDHFPVSEGLKRGPLDSIWYLVLVAAVYHGVAQAARNAIVEFSRTFSPGALGKPVATLPRFQDAVGEIETLQVTARRLLLSIADDYDRRSLKPEVVAGLQADASVARLVVIDKSIQITGIAQELAGNQGVSRLNAFERYHRDTLSARAHNPQAHLTRSNLGHRAFGLKRATPLSDGVASSSRRQAAAQ